ncbi:MAG: N-acetylneuraminate synthase [Candidatus Marinimicrobia bacterium]|nr:N-acetylneuraminate synthase [Candidatus Neomarinimicrobiota bacterium]
MIIAEIGLSHEGSLGSAHSYIDALASKGIDAIKFQTHIADAESSDFEPFRVNFSKQDKTRQQYWKRTEFTIEQWMGLKKHCEDLNIEFISTPSSISAVELLEKLNVARFKVGSGDTSNLLLLKRLGKTRKPILLSSGMSSFEELETSIVFLRKFGNPLTIMQCTSKYPTGPKDWGLNVIQELKNRFELPVGFSDHSGTIYASLAAAVMGAEVFEFHVVFDKRQFGPDVSSSITIDQVKILTEGIKAIQTAMNNPLNKNNISQCEDLKKMFGKSLSVNKNKKAGEIIKFEDLESKKPSEYGISAIEFEKVIGKTLNKNLAKWSFLNWEDLD